MEFNLNWFTPSVVASNVSGVLSTNMSACPVSLSSDYLLSTDINDVMLSSVVDAPLLSDSPRALMHRASPTSCCSPTAPSHLTSEQRRMLADDCLSARGERISRLSHRARGRDRLGGHDVARVDTLVEGTCVVTCSNDLSCGLQVQEFQDFSYQDYDTDLRAEDTGDIMELENGDEFCRDSYSDRHGNSVNKKPKVHIDPKLKLKGPLTYEKDVDPNVIPIEREGMARCEKCGAIGVRHAFYTRERRFCSLNCARSVEHMMVSDASALEVPDGMLPSDEVLDSTDAPLHDHACIKQYLCASDAASIGIDSSIVDLAATSRSYHLSTTSHVVSPGNTCGDMKLSQHLQISDCVNGSLSHSPSHHLTPIDCLAHLPAPSTSACSIAHSCDISHLTEICYDVPCSVTNLTHSHSTHSDTSYDWTRLLTSDSIFSAAPVACFRHAPMCTSWRNVCVGVKVEVANNLLTLATISNSLLESDRNSYSTQHSSIAASTQSSASRAYLNSSQSATSPMTTPSALEDQPAETGVWIATILRVEGYYGLLRYEGDTVCGSSGTCHSMPGRPGHSSGGAAFWLSLSSQDQVHPVGWCASQGRPLIPPEHIRHRHRDWRQFLLKQLTGARTLPANFHHRVMRHITGQLRPGHILEIVDKNCLAQVRAACVAETVGSRIHVNYLDASSDDNGYWCHENSSLVHHAGWAVSVGHQISAPADYLSRCEQNIRSECDVTLEMLQPPYPLCHVFRHVPPVTCSATTFNSSSSSSLCPSSKFCVGMKLEALDPLDLSTVGVATVQQVLSDDSLMIRLETYAPSDSDWFCRHAHSPYLLPARFSQRIGLPLAKPYNYPANIEFCWDSYLEMTGSHEAPAHLFVACDEMSTNAGTTHGFSLGHRLEAVDLMDPRRICVATVTDVKAHLLRIHFDGWMTGFDQWVDANSVDIFPVGWCRMVGYKLEPPRVQKSSQSRQHSPPSDDILPSRQGVSDDATLLPDIEHSTLTSNTLRPSVRLGADRCYDNNVSENLLSSAIGDHVQNVHLLQTESISHDDKIGEVRNNSPTAEHAVTSCAATSYCKSVERPLTSVLAAEHRDTSDKSSTEKQALPAVRHRDSGRIPCLLGRCFQHLQPSVQPNTWDVDDVVDFLLVNECSAYCDNFRSRGVDGRRLLRLSKDEMLQLTNWKVGPSLKIENLLNRLRSRLAPSLSIGGCDKRSSGSVIRLRNRSSTLLVNSTVER